MKITHINLAKHLPIIYIGIGISHPSLFSVTKPVLLSIFSTITVFHHYQGCNRLSKFQKGNISWFCGDGREGGDSFVCWAQMWTEAVWLKRLTHCLGVNGLSSGPGLLRMMKDALDKFCYFFVSLTPGKPSQIERNALFMWEWRRKGIGIYWCAKHSPACSQLPQSTFPTTLPT